MEDIKEKVNYCLNCVVKPCSKKGCPLENDIPTFIAQVKEENILEAYKTLCKTTVLPGVCGRICPHMKQCQGSCIRAIKAEPVSIGEIEAYIFDKAMEKGYTLKSMCKENQSENQNKEKYKNKRVAIIGAGPAGLTCAAFLAMEGVDVTIYEKHDYLGGILKHGIPEFRLSRNVLEKTIENILDLGIKVELNKELNKDFTLEEITSKYDAVFLAIGANKSSKMNVQGEDLEGVFGGNELLENNLCSDFKDKIVCINGGGNVAMDCARTINKMGAKQVNVIYRRAREQMPAEAKEIEDAIEEGVNFLFQNNITKIKGNGKVEELELIKTELREKPGESRLVPVNVEGSNYNIKCDYVIMALGSKPESFVEELGLELNNWGNIAIDDNYQTSNSKIYSGGDLAGIKGTVAWASKSGREAAKSILNNL